MKVPKVSLKDWKGLYAASQDFHERKPWKTFNDSTIFGVRDPQTGDTGYACILGAGGEYFGLCVYRGARGYDVYSRTVSGKIDPEYDDVTVMQDCLMLEYTDDVYLEQEDFNVLERLGISFDGKNAWPLFRSFVPGSFPWHLNKVEVNFLTLALHCTNDVIEKAASGNISFDEDDDGLLVCVPSAEGKSDIQMIREDLPVYEPPTFQPYRINEVLVAKVQLGSHHQDAVWEAGWFSFPSKITDRDRPYMGMIPFVVDRTSYYLLSRSDMKAYDEISAHQAIGDSIVNGILEHGHIPKIVMIRGALIVDLLQPLAQALGIGIIECKHLDVLRHVRQEMHKHMHNR